jgi:hypothetical protein
MAKHLYVFRPGEEARMLARCQFSVHEDGRCGATLTYPIKGHPWRRNVMRSYAFPPLGKETRDLLFAEVHRMRREHPEQCLASKQLWSDTSERANGITRDKATGTLCWTLGILVEGGPPAEYFAMREDSEVLVASALYTTICRLIEPFEKL